MYRKIFVLLLISMLAIQSVVAVYNVNNDASNKNNQKEDTSKRKYIITDDGFIIIDKDKIIKVTISTVETKGSVTGAHYPGEWKNTNYNYRINITVTEPAGYARQDWPVDVYVEFDPWANRQGITVMDDVGNNVTFQIWSTTGNTTHISSATITFLATVGAYSSAKYYIYYDADPVGRPTFPTQVTLSTSTDPVTGQTIYTITGEGYSKAVLAPGKQIGSKYVWTGGRILEIEEASTDLNIYTSPMNDIGISRNPSLNNPLGDANATRSPEDRYVDSETQNGPIFILYRVINAPIYDTNNITIAKANVTYKFFKWGWIAEMYVKWITNDTDQNATYWVGVYSFDQDNGIDVVYDRVSTPSGTTILGEGLPWTKSEINPDWGREDLTNNLRAFITPALIENHQYLVELSWSGYVDLDVFIYSERGFLIEGYDDLWDKKDGFVATQDYYESETATATVSERWIIVVLAYCSEGASASFTVDVTDQTASQPVISFSGSFAASDFIYTSRYDAYCNYYAWGYPDTIDESREGNVDYRVGGYAKRYFADDELLAYILPMPKTGGDDYYIRVSWDLEFSIVHYHIYYPDGTEWTQDTSGGSPPLTATLYPPVAGDYVILIHYYDGSYYDADDQSPYDDTTVELYFEPPFAETEDYSDSGSWDWVAFYHHYYNRSIGFVNLSLEMNIGRTTGAFEDLYWGNKGEGPSADEDYILWALRIGGVNASQSDWLKAKYAVVFAGENGSQTIQYMADRLRNPLGVSLSSTERFTLLITYNVTDADGGPIVNAEVRLINKTSGLEVASGYTDSSGIIVFDIPRYDNYTLNITLVSAHNTYTIALLDRDYSTISYTTFSRTEHYQNSSLVRIVMQCNDTEGKVLQSAIVRFNGTQAYEYTNLSGYIDVYIWKGVWNLTIGYKYDYDMFNLTYTNGTFVKNTSGQDVAAVRWSMIDITSGQHWYLIDLDAAAPPPLAIELREGSYSFDVYWGEYVYVKVAITSQGALIDADNNVTWRIEYANNNSIVPGFNTSKMSLVSTGIYDVNISTYKLPADYTYYLIIDVNTTTIGGKTYFFDANSNKYQRPQPLVITIKVKPRPTKITIISLTSNIYWDEQFEVRLYYQDALNDTYLPGASVTIKFEGPTTFEGTLSQSGNEYIYSILAFDYPTGAYTLTIIATKGNYSTSTYTTTLIVNERPTEVFAPSYVEIPWSTENYNVTIQYNDSRREILVVGATTSYEIYDADTQILLVTGTLIETSNGYIFSIPVLKIGIGSYTAKIYISKTYYEEKTFSITIIIHERSTYATVNTTSVRIIWNETAYVLVSYYDSEYSPAQKITGATATFQVTPFGSNETVYTGDLSPYGNDYLLTINFTQNLTIGNYRIKVTLFKSNYTSQLLEIDLIVDPIPTTASASATSITLEWGLNVSLTFWYNRTDKDKGVPEASNASFKLYYNGSLVLKGNLSDIGNGQYQIILNTTRFVNDTHPYLGTYTMYVFLEKPYHENQTLTISITVEEVSMTISASTTQLSIIWGYTENITIYYNRSRDERFIQGATETITSTPNATGAFTWIELTGKYILNINATNMESSQTYTVNVTLTKQFHQTKTIVITIDVQPIPTTASSSLASAETEYGLNLTIEFWYNRTDTDEGVGGATAVYEIKNGSGIVILNGSLVEDVNVSGKYYFNLNTSDVVAANTPQDVGTYTIYVMFSKTHYESRSLVITWTITLVDVICYVSSSNVTLTWGDFTVVEIYYNRSRDKVFIGGASYTLVVYNESGYPISVPSGAFSVSEGVGAYLLSINTTYLDTVLYILELTFSRAYYEDGVVRIFVDVEPISAFAVPSQKSAEVEYPKNFTFKVWYYTEDYNITDANAMYTVEYGGSIIDSGNLTFNSTDNSYELFMYTVDLFNKSGAVDLPITLTVYVYLSRAYHESKTLILAYTINPIKTKLTLSESSATLRYGQYWIFYMNYTDITGETSLYDAIAKYNITLNGTLIESGTIPYNTTDTWREFYLVFNSTYILNKTLSIMDVRLPVIYEIRVWFGKRFYEKQSAVLSVTVNPMETALDISASSVTIKYGESWLFNFSYIDVVREELILNATTYYEIRYGGVVLKNGSLAFNDTYKYYIIFDSTEIINESWPYLGAYALYVYFWKRFYMYKEKVISITVEPRDTYVETNATSVTIEYGDVCVFELRYIDVKASTNISGAEAIYEIIFNESIVRRGSLYFDNTTEAYYFWFESRKIINTSWPYLGTYVINIYFGKLFYVNITKVLSITVEKIKTVVYAQPEEIKVVWGMAPEVLIYYLVAKNGSIIPWAVVNVTSTPATAPGAFIVDYNESRGVYVLKVNSSYLSVEAYYVVDILLNKTFFMEQTVKVKVYVEPISTDLNIVPESVEVEYGDIIEFIAEYIVYGTGEIVADAETKFVIRYGEYNLSSGSFYFDGQKYVLRVNTTEIVSILEEMPGVDYVDLPVTVAVDVRFSKSVYKPWSRILAITIYDIASTVDLTETEITAEWAENVSVGIRIIRNKTLETVKDINISVIAPDMPNVSWRIVETDDGYLLLINTTMLEVVEVLNKSYRITLSFSKPYYDIPSKTIVLTVKKIMIDVSFVGTPPSVVEKWQIFEEAKTTNIDVLVEHRGVPVEDAEIEATIFSVDAGISRKLYVSATDIPGVFRITINWKDYPPGYKWTIVVRVTRVKAYGVYVPSDKVIYTEISHVVRMDYVSGSTRIEVPGVGKVYMANMFYYPILAVIALLLMFAGYKGITWHLTPWEVKQINKILKMIAKGIFEYSAPERGEYILEMISKELGVEV